MPLKRLPITKCRKQRIAEEAMLEIVMSVRTKRANISRMVVFHNLGMPGEAIAMICFETYHRKFRHRGIRYTDDVLVAALDNMLHAHVSEPFLPNRNNLRRLNDMAKTIVLNRTAPTNTWQTAFVAAV